MPGTATQNHKTWALGIFCGQEHKIHALAGHIFAITPRRQPNHELKDEWIPLKGAASPSRRAPHAAQLQGSLTRCCELSVAWNSTRWCSRQRSPSALLSSCAGWQARSAAEVGGPLASGQRWSKGLCSGQQRAAATGAMPSRGRGACVPSAGGRLPQASSLTIDKALITRQGSAGGGTEPGGREEAAPAVSRI